MIVSSLVCGSADQLLATLSRAHERMRLLADVQASARAGPVTRSINEWIPAGCYRDPAKRPSSQQTQTFRRTLRQTDDVMSTAATVGAVSFLREIHYERTPWAPESGAGWQCARLRQPPPSRGGRQAPPSGVRLKSRCLAMSPCTTKTSTPGRRGPDQAACRSSVRDALLLVTLNTTARCLPPQNAIDWISLPFGVGSSRKPVLSSASTANTAGCGHDDARSQRASRGKRADDSSCRCLPHTLASPASIPSTRGDRP